MEETLEQLLEKVEKLFKEKKYQRIVDLLPDEVLQKHKFWKFHFYKAFSLNDLTEYERALNEYSLTIEYNPHSMLAYHGRGDVWYNLSNEDNAIKDYNKAIEIDHKFSLAYCNRGFAWYEMQKYDKAIKDFNDAIILDPNFSSAYYGRGNVFSDLKDFDNALEDYNKAIENNSDSSSVPYYNNRGAVWVEKKQYDKARLDYTIAIELDPTYARAYFNRGNTWMDTKEYDKAILDYDKAIEIDNKQLGAYYNRAISYEEIGDFLSAINNYNTYCELTSEKNDFWVKQAKANIKELKKKIAFAPYEEISKIVEDIKNLLMFEGECITHYTALTTAKLLLLDEKSRLRLSEGTFLNDTSEGRVLFKELGFHITKKDNRNDKSESEPFTEKPFIGSFVAENKHDDLTLWRMYGKENKEEARGCALTLKRQEFIDDVLKSLTVNQENDSLSFNKEFVFYNVAYISKNNGGKFVIPNNQKNEIKLNELISELKIKTKNIRRRDLKVNIAEKLNEIVYLFKDAEYQYENEVRLIVSGVGFSKEVNFENSLGVYVYLTDIRAALHKITLGPKVDRAEELAAALNYHLKEKYPDKEVEIIMSHLPFK